VLGGAAATQIPKFLESLDKNSWRRPCPLWQTLTVLELFVAEPLKCLAWQEKLSKSALNESRLEEEAVRARQRADDAENQLTKAELLHRSLDGDNQRLKLALNDKETESQAWSTICFVTDHSSGTGN